MAYERITERQDLIEELLVTHELQLESVSTLSDFLLKEVVDCFEFGMDIATILTSYALVEAILRDQRAIDLAFPLQRVISHSKLPQRLKDGLQHLRVIRNELTHARASNISAQLAQNQFYDLETLLEIEAGKAVELVFELKGITAEP